MVEDRLQEVTDAQFEVIDDLLHKAIVEMSKQLNVEIKSNDQTEEFIMGLRNEILDEMDVSFDVVSK